MLPIDVWSTPTVYAVSVSSVHFSKTRILFRRCIFCLIHVVVVGVEVEVEVEVKVVNVVDLLALWLNVVVICWFVSSTKFRFQVPGTVYFLVLFLMQRFCIKNTKRARSGPPKYMLGRRTCEAEMERELSTKPFETYELYRGQRFGADEGDSSYREVGKFKVRPPPLPSPPQPQLPPPALRRRGSRGFHSKY